MEIYPDPPKDDGTETDDPPKNKKEEIVVKIVDGEAEVEKERLEALKMDVKQVIEQQPSLETVLRSNTHGSHRRGPAHPSHRQGKSFHVRARQLGVGTVRRANSQRVGVDHRLRSEPHQHQRSHRQPAVYQRINYSNWELSADRANAARRALIAGGLREDKIGPSGRIVRVRAARPRQLAKPDQSTHFDHRFEQTHRAGDRAGKRRTVRRADGSGADGDEARSRKVNRESRFENRKENFLTNPESRVTNHVLQGI